MDPNTLLTLAKQLTTKFSPTKVEVSDAGRFSARILIVSDAFAELSLSQRFDGLYSLFYAPGKIPRTFLIEFQAWTENEYRQISSTSGTTGSGQNDGGGAEGTRKKVASPGDDFRSPMS